MFNRFKEKFARFMYGRNGNDSFNTFHLICALIVLFATSFAKNSILRPVFNLAAIILLGFVYFRMFSKNIYKRSIENRKYLDVKLKVFSYLKGIKERWVQRKDYKFFYCPSCHSSLRVPRGHGKIKIVCKKCGNTFIGKS